MLTAIYEGFLIGLKLGMASAMFLGVSILGLMVLYLIWYVCHEIGNNYTIGKTRSGEK